MVVEDFFEKMPAINMILDADDRVATSSDTSCIAKEATNQCQCVRSRVLLIDLGKLIHCVSCALRKLTKIFDVLSLIKCSFRIYLLTIICAYKEKSIANLKKTFMCFT